ncbi:MAG: hypothetical protein LH616_03085, partial [Ilumatobacteraceae bacterium]|nr:hypothetical protein [Ilumatobacteraceae bacterium]
PPRNAAGRARAPTHLPFSVSSASCNLPGIRAGGPPRTPGGAGGARDAAELHPFKLQVEAAAASAEQMLEQLS